jgi:hypothetical protein
MAISLIGAADAFTNAFNAGTHAKSIGASIRELDENIRLLKMINDQIEKGIKAHDDAALSLDEAVAAVEQATTPRERADALASILGGAGGRGYEGLNDPRLPASVQGLVAQGDPLRAFAVAGLRAGRHASRSRPA